MCNGPGAALSATAVVLLIAAATDPAAAAPPDGGAWRQVFNEEFTRPALDLDKWTDCYWWDRDGCTNLSNNELQWYRPENISVSDGKLNLTARPQSVVGHEGRIFPFTSGLVTTGRYYEERPEPDRYSWLYGYLEVRAKAPSGQGLWSAIWMLPSDHESKPEIDVMEVLGHQPEILELHFHCGYGECAGRSFGHEVETADLTSDFRVYGVNWTPDAIIWYLDGVEQWRFTDRAAIPNEPMYLLLNLAVGGDWPGDPDHTTTFPAEFLVDYVRIWQRVEHQVANGRHQRP